MSVVRTIQDAELEIGKLYNRIEKLENALKPKITQNVTEIRTVDIDNEALDINFGADATIISHFLKHIFNGEVKFTDIELFDFYPTVTFEYASVTPVVAKGRIYLNGVPVLGLSVNLGTDGSVWNLDDTSTDGSLFIIRKASLEWYYATAGSNPRTLTSIFKTDSGNRLYNNSIAILNVQQSDPGAGPSSPSITTLGIGGTAGGTYTGVEQNLINSLSTNNGNLNTDVSNLKTAVDALITMCDNIRTALRNHGLCA